jgi:hypothetical protein
VLHGKFSSQILGENGFVTLPPVGVVSKNDCGCLT